MSNSPDASRFLGYRLIVKSDLMARRFAAELAEVGLRVHEFSVMAMLASRPSATAAELAEAVLITPQSMGPLLDRLEASGAIHRPAVRGKGRTAPAQLTEAGRVLLKSAFDRVGAIDAEYRNQLGEDYERFAAIVDRWTP